MQIILGHAHSHTHDHSGLQGNKLLVSILLNILITVSQVVGGLISGSLALLSDALHNFSDVLSLVFSYAAHRLTHKKPTYKRTFGYKRAEIMAAFINAATLVIVALFLIYEAVGRFSEPQTIASGLVIWLSLIGILANGFSVVLLKADSSKNLNMRSAYLHLLTDTMASVAVLAGGLLMKFFGWFWVDAALTMAIALYLIYVGYDLLRDSYRMLMMFAPAHLDLEEIADKVHGIDGIARFYHIHLWQMNDEQLHLEAHIQCTRDFPISEFNVLADRIEALLEKEFGISHCTFQPDFNKSCAKDFIAEE